MNTDDWKSSIKVDRELKIPLYHQISQNLRYLIMDGHLQLGEMIPSEWELSDLCKVSRLTVRSAVDELVREGWLVRRHGVGTFVDNPKLTQITPSKLGFTQKMRQIGREPSSRLVSIEVVPATAKVAASLRLKSNAAVVKVVRVRLADGEPIMLETAHLPQERFPKLAEANLGEGSLYRFLNEHYQVTIVAVDQTLEPVILNEHQAHLLDTEPGSLALRSEVMALTTDDEPVEYSWAVTRGDKCRFFFSFREGEAGETT